ncbi:Penicillin-binding protein [Paramyrothecium foliicola]|nr:Penicillin-binding protein [Paramyrothecium foliicola]
MLLPGASPHLVDDLAASVSASDVARRLRARIPTVEEIRAITCQPALSIGVIHRGEQVFQYNTGVTNAVTGQKPDGDTLYCIASLSKAFMSAALDLLVQDHKISWDDTIQSIIPEFSHVAKPEIYANMTVRDICSHRTGLLSLDEVTQGLDARILIDKKDVVKVCNALPIKHHFRTDFLYNNALFELAGNIVERISGKTTWGDFHEERIFRPLGMARTTAFRSVHDCDSNIATPYMVLTHGELSPIAPTELDAHSMNGGSGGVRSSVNDLLKWCAQLIKSFSAPAGSETLARAGSPFWNRHTIANPSSAADGDYCLGWCLHRTPAKLGLISPNRTLESPTVGAGSRSLSLYSHQGDVPGYTCNLYLIPETESAVVVLSNGTGLSDATDWIAQDFIQTMYALQPSVNFVDVAARASKKYLSHYEVDFKIPLAVHQRAGTPSPQLQDFVGLYIMDGLDVVGLDVSVDAKDNTKLSMMVNEQRDQVWKLSHYHYDVFCQLPSSYDECLIRGLDRTAWSSFLISFLRDSRGAVKALNWKMDEVNVQFSRASSPSYR